MMRLRLGPYKDMPRENVLLYAPPLVSTIELGAGRAVSERIVASAGLLFNIRLRYVTYGRSLPRYPIQWRVELEDGGATRELGAGTIDAKTLRDWAEEDLLIPLTYLEQPTRLIISVSVAKDLPGPSAGLPIFKSGAGMIAGPIEGDPEHRDGVGGLTLQYARS